MYIFLECSLYSSLCTILNDTSVKSYIIQLWTLLFYFKQLQYVKWFLRKQHLFFAYNSKHVVVLFQGCWSFIMTQPQPYGQLFPFMNTLWRSQQCYTVSYSWSFIALQERAHPYNADRTFSKTSKTSGEETHQSDWPLAQKHSQPHSTQLQTPENGCKGNPTHLLRGFVNYALWNMFALPLKFDTVPAGSTSLNWSRFESLSVYLRQHLITSSAFFETLTA